MIQKSIQPFKLALALFMAVASMPLPAQADARIKDIATFEGIRENMLMGYGLVVGLKATGDNLKNNAFTEQSLIAFLERQGVNTRGTELKSKNVAAVTVTAKLPPFARSGGKIDVTVSAMGDAKDLTGGMLLATPLYGADGEVYAVAQGSVSIGGFQAGSGSTTITKGVPTSGVIASGAIVEKEIEFALNSMPELKIALRNPDISTAKNVAESINNNIGPGIAMVSDPGTIVITVPASYLGNNTQLLAEVEKLTVPTDQVARIVIDEASGTIVMGENVRIDTVAVAQGNLIVKVETTTQVSQPGAFAPEGAETVTTEQTAVSVEESGPGKKMAVLSQTATLKDLVAGLNALGVTPRDLITILQTIKAAGALQAEIHTR
ncbi:MAG: flagellar basal body P-ring protein FlgI [Rickettsiales bacterium]|jgi:flagellar P-ring protein precursor FlgI|nr:flagellar basal body P-ring protein FlgI [Rickettsiales bacterium]